MLSILKNEMVIRHLIIIMGFASLAVSIVFVYLVVDFFIKRLKSRNSQCPHVKEDN